MIGAFLEFRDALVLPVALKALRYGCRLSCLLIQSRFRASAGNHQFLSQHGVRDLDMRVLVHYFYTGITPAMVAKMVGKGSQYVTATIDL
jgi:hypothetical protein